MAQRQPMRSISSEPSLGPLFQEIRDALQVSWTPSTFEQLAEIPDYLRIAWTALKPVAATAQFLRAAERLWQEALDDVEDIYRPSYGTGDLQQLGVTLQDQAEARTALTALLYGGSQTLLAITALTQAIHGRLTGDPQAMFWPRSRTTWSLELIPMASERASAEIERRVFEQARHELGLAETPRALRLVGRFPRYLDVAWSDVVPLFGQGELSAAVNDLIELSERRVGQLPHGVEVTPEHLQKAGLSQRKVERIRKILDTSLNQIATELILTALLRYPLGSLRGGF